MVNEFKTKLIEYGVVLVEQWGNVSKYNLMNTNPVGGKLYCYR
jgi:hypothetical protein